MCVDAFFMGVNGTCKFMAMKEWMTSSQSSFLPKDSDPPLITVRVLKRMQRSTTVKHANREVKQLVAVEPTRK